MKVRFISKQDDGSFEIVIETGIIFKNRVKRYAIPVDNKIVTNYFWRDTGKIVMPSECSHQLDWMDENGIKFFGN
jgi:hypothetical protein